MATAALAKPTEAERAAPLEPYKGLAPYLESDSDLFFGRERETEIICANLMAARLTLLYGESGVGKSSVLLAGAAHQLREEARRYREEHGRPDFAVVVYRTWRDNPVEGLIAEIRRAVSELIADDDAAESLEGGTLADLLRAAADRLDGDVLVILDQFDEYFLYHGTEDGEDTFAVQFPQAVNEGGLRANFLVSMREDTVAKLDRFKGRIPFLFDNRLRIDHLGIGAAREAIERPIAAFNERANLPDKVEIEPALVEEILRQIGGRDVALTPAGAVEVSKAPTASNGDRVQAPYLQIVLRRIWLEEVKEGSSVLRADTLERLGGAENIVRTRFAEVMGSLTPSERETAADVFRFLVTRSGTKVAHSAADLADFTDLDEGQVAAVLAHMADQDIRLLRPVQPASGAEDGTRYEIAHDIIGPAILAWRTHYEQEKRQHRERRKTRIWAGTALASLLLCAGVALLGIWAWQQKEEADDATVQADAAELAARARAVRNEDPARAVGLALEALEANEKSGQAEDVLREALPAFRARRIISDVGDPAAAAISGSAGRPLLALPTEDQAMRIVDAETGEDASVLAEPGDVFTSSFSADASRLVTTPLGGTATLWDTESGNEISRLPGADTVYVVAFDPSGNSIVGTDLDGGLNLWNGESGAQLDQKDATSEGGVVWSLSFSDDGSRLATVSSDTTDNVRLWFVSATGLQESGRIPTAFEGQEGAEREADATSVPFTAAALDPAGTRLVTADENGRVQVWDAATRAPERMLAGAVGETSDLAFSPDGKLVAAAQDKVVRVWRVATGERLAEMQGHQDWVNVVEFRPDGENVLSASSDGTARVWEARTGLPVLELRGHHGAIVMVDYLAGEKLAATVSEDGTVRTWDVETGIELRGHRDWVLDATYNSDGTLLATVGSDGRLVTWDPITHERQDATEAGLSSSAVNTVEFSPDGRILTGADDGTAALWDPETLDYDSQVYHGDRVTGASFNPDGDRIVTSSTDGTVRVWDPAEPDEQLFDLQAAGLEQTTHDGPVLDARFSPDGTRIVTVGADELARVWSSDGRELGKFEGHDGIVWRVSFNPDDPELVVTGSRDRTARIWNTEDPSEQIAKIEQPEAVTSVAFSPDGELVVTGSPGGVTRVWDWRPVKLLAVMRMHGDYINSAEFSPDQRLIVTASDDRTLKLYPCEVCAGLETLERMAREQTAALRPAP